MPSRTRTIREDDLWDLAERLDLPSVVLDGLRAPAGPAGRLVSSGAGCRLATFDDPVSGLRWELPARSLRALRSAAVVTLSARHLLAPGVVTAGVLGAAPTVWWHVAALCRHVRSISHVTVCTGGGPVPPRLADQLDLAGVGFCRVPTPADAAFGATLLVALGDADRPERTVSCDDLTAGAVLIEAEPASLAGLHGLADEVLRADELAGVPPAGRPPGDGFLLVGPPGPDRVSGLDTVVAAALAAAVGGPPDVVGPGPRRAPGPAAGGAGRGGG
jgi:hypothetical protein